VDAELGWIDAETAIFATSTVCGLALVPPAQRDVLRATTRGVGELIWEAVDRGARGVVIGLGGSATVDGGTGAARGLGWSFYDESGSPLPEGGGSLARLARCSRGWSLTAKIVALADVQTPLTGPDGSAPVFGPQKGASADAVAQLAFGLNRLAELFARHGRADLATAPGGGAAGGLGAGLAFFSRAQLEPGAPWVLERVGFDAALATADLVITAEGRFDRTSLAGKAPGEVVRRAQLARKKVAVIAGSAADILGVHVVAGNGGLLDVRAISALAERATREAFGLPAP
jgi:glycerate kinase